MITLEPTIDEQEQPLQTPEESNAAAVPAQPETPESEPAPEPTPTPPAAPPAPAPVPEPETEPEREPEGTEPPPPAPPTEPRAEKTPTVPTAPAEDTPPKEENEPPAPTPIATEGLKREYWKKVLTGDPATVPAAVRRKAGVDTWDAPEDQRVYRLLSTVNKSWAADHLPRTREQISSAWPQQRAELTHKLGVRDNEHELFLALSEEEKDAPRKEAAREIYAKAYMAGLDGQDLPDPDMWRGKLSDEDAQNALPLADMAYMEGQQKRDRMQGLAQRIANGLDAFAAIEEDAVSAPRVIMAAPDLIRAIDELADMDEEQQNTALYLAAGLVKQNKGYDTPGLLARSIQAVRRGATGIAAGALQMVANTGIASLNKLGEQLESEGLRSTAADWDKRMRMFQKLKNMSQQELRPLVLPQETNRAASYLITAAEATPSAILSCCGGAGFTALTLGAVGESVAEARNRAPLASQELQLYAGLLGGTIQAGIYMNLNRVGGRLLEQAISRIGRVGGQGIAGYTLAGLNVMGATTAEAAKMLAAGKLAQATDLGAQELAARLSQTASNIDWQEFGDNLTDIEANMHEAAALLPFLLLGSGRLALQHFRSPRAILGEGKLLSDWGLSEQQQEAILTAPTPDAQTRILQEALINSRAWGGLSKNPAAWRALRLLHSDSFHEFQKPEQIRDFLQLPPPQQQEELPPPTAKVKRRLPHDPDQPGLKPRIAEAMKLWNEWWRRANVGQVPAPYPDAAIFDGVSKQPQQLSMRAYEALSYSRMDTQLPRRTRELSIYAPHAEVEREMMLRDRVKHLNELSYQFIMSVYSVDSLARNPRTFAGWRSLTERTRKCLLGAVVKSIVSTARGVDRTEALETLNNYVSNFYLRRKYKGNRASWLRDTKAGALQQLPANAEAYFINSLDTPPEMMNAYRLVSGLRSCSDALMDLLPYTRDFQTALSRGLNPAGAYSLILNREFGLPHEQTQTENSQHGKDVPNVTPMLQYTRENAEAFKLYSQLSGHSIERARGDDSVAYSRTRRPDGTLTHWHEQDLHVMNDVAGNASLLFLPFGSHRGNITQLYTKDGTDLNLLRRPYTEPGAYTPYDQLCNIARHELSRLWLENLPDVQLGLHMKRIHRYLLRKQHDPLKPLIEEFDNDMYRYGVDPLSQATPLSMALARFCIYWQRMLHSGLVSPEELGDYLTAQGALTAAEKKALLSPSSRAQNDPLADIPRNMAEKMADYTVLRFLAALRGMPLPNTVKEWVGMAAFCPEEYLAAETEETAQGKALSLRDGGAKLTGWANRAAARKLRELAPQVEKVRKKLATTPGGNPFIDPLLKDAMGLDKTMGYEQSWCFHVGGLKTLLGLPQSHWNMLRFPRRTWQRMSKEERAPYRERLAPICDHEPLFLNPENPAHDPVEAALFFLDDLLREYPEMHRFSMEGGRLDSIRMMTLNRPNTERDPMHEPFYRPIPVYQWRNKLQKGYRVSSTSMYLPEFFTADRHAELGLTLLDELRSTHHSIPHAYRNGIWWRGALYGLGGRSPMRDGQFYAERPIEPLITLLQSIGRYEAEHGPMKVCGIHVRGLEPNLNLRPLEAITIYRSKADRRVVYRLMPGDVTLGNHPMGLPYLVHCRDGVYLGKSAVVRTAEDMPASFVPLHLFAPQARRAYNQTNKEYWSSAAWKYNLSNTLRRAAEAQAPADEPTHYNEMLEYLMRLAEDSGFSPSLAEMDPQTLTQGQARLLNLVRDMVAALCSNAPETACKTLAEHAQILLRSPQHSRELLGVLRHSNASIPGIKIGAMLEMEDIFAHELDRALLEREAELEAEGVELQNEQSDESNFINGEHTESIQMLRPWKYDDVRSKVEEAVKYHIMDGQISEDDDTIDFQTCITTAQLNAVFAGRKPAFFEPFQMCVRLFAHNLPPGIKYAETEHGACIYHEQAAARALGIPPGKKLHEAICAVMESEENGLLLGYGAPFIFTRPCYKVRIYRNEKEYCGFTTSPDKAEAKHYAEERKKDFTDQFPDDKWRVEIIYTP